MDDTVLTTPRARLRLQTRDDIPFLVALWTDPETTRYLGGPRDPEFLAAEFARVALDPRAEEFDLWPMELLSSRELVGYAGLLPKTVDGEDFLEVTYLVAPSFRGRGLAQEVARALVERALGPLGRPAVVALVAPGNEASRRVADRAGLQFWKTAVREGGNLREVWRATSENSGHTPSP